MFYIMAALRTIHNGDPASGYSVILDTVDGCEYGNNTNARGEFYVIFRDDGSPTCTMKVADTKNFVLYTDPVPRPMNLTGPSNIGIEVPSLKQVSVTITPPGILMALG